MIKIIYIFFFVLVTIIGTSLLTPKDKLYFQLEKTLLEKDIKINENKIENIGLNKLSISNLNIYLEDINVLVIENILFSGYFLYNKIDIKNITLSKELKNIFPIDLTEIELIYNVINPTYISVFGNNKAFKINGNINLIEHSVYLKLIPNKFFNNRDKKIILNVFSINKAGEYYYETKF